MVTYFRAAVIALCLALLVTGCNTPASSGAAGTPSPSSAQFLHELTVVLDWTPNTNHTGMYVALAKGWYTDAGLEVKLVQPPEGGALSLLAADKAQFAVSFQEEIATALSSSSPLPVQAVAAIIDHNQSGLISLKETGISSPKDLENKRYATWDTPLERAIIARIMSDDGADPAKLVYIPNTVTDIFSAMQSDIDLVWVYYAWDGVAAEVKGVACNYLDFSELNPIFDFYTPVLASSNHFLEQNPEAAQAFLAATSKGYAYAIENPEEAGQILCRAAPELDSELVTASQKYLASRYRGDKPQWGTIDAERWGNFYHWLYREKIIPIDLGIQGFTNAYLP